mmetsp:Transcript_19427/g.42239  ORF Transcript_19427/g.42239 Transcript_19427/m.42239 type:complete len:392 (-) Transcript_19427:450-1625(-)
MGVMGGGDFPTGVWFFNQFSETKFDADPSLAKAIVGEEPIIGDSCVISSYGHDGIGHQMEAKLSCIAVAEVMDNMVYAHRPMDVAQHGSNATASEMFFGIQRALSSLSSAVLFNKKTMNVQPRNPLPYIGQCHKASWFDEHIRIPACYKSSKLNETVVFTSDNCWDYFYCELKRNPKRIKTLWQTKIAPSLKEALQDSPLLRQLTKDSLLHPSIIGHEKLRVVAHVRRGDAGGRGVPANLFRALINKLIIAWGEGKPLDIVIHTDGEDEKVIRETGVEKTSDINLQVFGRDSKVSVEKACYDMIHADIFLASVSSLSNTCGLYRDKHPSTILYPENTERIGLAGLGWSMVRARGSNVLIYNNSDGQWNDAREDFFIDLIDQAISKRTLLEI